MSDVQTGSEASDEHFCVHRGQWKLQGLRARLDLIKEPARGATVLSDAVRLGCVVKAHCKSEDSKYAEPEETDVLESDVGKVHGFFRFSGSGGRLTGVVTMTLVVRVSLSGSYSAGSQVKPNCRGVFIGGKEYMSLARFIDDLVSC